MTRRQTPVSELLRLACLYAEHDREDFIDAYQHMPNDPACLEAMRFLAELRAYRRKRWGRTGSDRLSQMEAQPIPPAPARRTKR